MEIHCGKVSSVERDEIKGLFFRKIALTELYSGQAKTMSKETMDKILSDLGQTTYNFHQWWTRKAEQYAWPLGQSWRIDFDSCEVFLNQLTEG